MSTAYRKQPSNVVAIQAAVLSIIQSAPGYQFASSGLDRVPTPQELQPKSTTAVISSMTTTVLTIGGAWPGTLVAGVKGTLIGGSGPDMPVTIQAVNGSAHTATLAVAVTETDYTEIVWMGAVQLPAAYVLKPKSSDKVSPPIPGLVQHDWDIPVHLIWPYRIPDEVNDELIKQAESDFTDLFDSNYDLNGTCAPTAEATGFEGVYWSDVDSSVKAQWISLAFSVYAHEDLDRLHLPPL